MKRKITIDLVKDTVLDLTLEELEVVKEIVNFSIKQVKKKKPTEPTLFGQEIKNPNATTIFVNSSANDLEHFKLKLLKEGELGVDLDYYFNAVKDWSEMNRGKKRTDNGWIATARNFMRSDNEKKKLKTINNPADKNHNEDMLDYLKT